MSNIAPRDEQSEIKSRAYQDAQFIRAGVPVFCQYYKAAQATEWRKQVDIFLREFEAVKDEKCA